MISQAREPERASDGPRVRRRRRLVAALVLTTMLLLAGTLAFVLAADGLSLFDLGMLAAFALTLPWNVVNFWNALIGLTLLCRYRDPAAAIVPQLARHDPAAGLRGRTAILVPIFNEDPGRVFQRLEAMRASLDDTGEGERFELFVLSDSSDPVIVAAEMSRFEAWVARERRPERLHYRRRADNGDAKTGNLWDFLDSQGHRFDYGLVLDADSLMTGAAMVRMARLMDADAQLGIVQTLIAGLPSRSAFARILQFGMRHGLRSYATGSAWWQGASGPYWGHNAILRLAPFRAHCRLPVLPGRPPFGGRILSHDQVEAVLIRRAGYEVRVVPDEFGSYEENPPTLPDFLKRDLRWCQGNMQYGRLLSLPGLSLMARLQLALAMLMYVQAPAWMAFMALGMAQAAAVALGLITPAVVAPESAALAQGLGLGLFAAVMTMIFAPKLAGVLQTLLQARVRRAYGGGWRVLGSLGVEFLFSTLLAPVLAVVHTKFILLMFFGRTVIWTEQARTARHVPLPEALRNLWAPPLVGLGFLATALTAAPGAIPWLLPAVTGMVLGPFFAWATSLPAFGRWAERVGLCALPEEFAPPFEVRLAGYEPARSPSAPFGAEQPQRLAGTPVGAVEPALNLQKSD